MIQTNKALLAVLAIVIAVGFVAASSVTSQASAQGRGSLCISPKHGLTIGDKDFPAPCVGSGAPSFVPPVKH